MTGLPEGPIANPSRAAIKAVLNPQAPKARAGGCDSILDSIDNHIPMFFQ